MTAGFSVQGARAGALLTISAAPALAAPCGTGTFEAWLEDFKKEAAAKGISQSAIASRPYRRHARQGRDRARPVAKGVFSQSFEEFSGRMVPPRLARGSNMLKQYGSVLWRIEQTYGVPGEILVAIWGLETDFGVNIGKFPTLRSLATLAYDCRRADLFKAELMDALRIVERGDIAPQEMRGAWAGEIGQTQFMPSSPTSNMPSTSTATAAAICCAACPTCWPRPRISSPSYGWQRGKDWEPGSANFAVIQQWNKSEVYSKTIGYFATPARARALSRNQGADRKATGPSSQCLLRHTSRCIALLRCMPQAPILPLSIASCAAAISFCAANLPSPSAIASIVASVLVEVGAAAAGAHPGGVGGNDGVGNGSHGGCCEQFIEHVVFPFSVFGSPSVIAGICACN